MGGPGWVWLASIRLALVGEIGMILLLESEGGVGAGAEPSVGEAGVSVWALINWVANMREGA